MNVKLESGVFLCLIFCAGKAAAEVITVFVEGAARINITPTGEDYVFSCCQITGHDRNCIHIRLMPFRDK